MSMLKTLIATSAILAFVACDKKKEDTPKAEPAGKTAEPASKTAEPAAKPAEPAAKPAPTAETPDIVAIAIGNEDFSTLVTALKAADLVGALQGEGPFTVFAPTNDAFAKVPAKALEALLADKEKLAAVLKYHVVSGKVMAADVGKLSEATTLQGGTLKIDTTDGVKIGAAKVIKADIAAKNGVIHVIDTVLIPE